MAAYSKWFRAQVDAGIKEADDPATRWISNEDAEASMEKLLTRLEAEGKCGVKQKMAENKA